MAELIRVSVPDIGDFEDVEVVEILVAKGDVVQVEDSLVSLESDKATMEIPSPVAGRVEEVKVGLGDRVSEGSLLVLLVPDGAAAEADATAAGAAAPDAASPETEPETERGSATRERPAPDAPAHAAAVDAAPLHTAPLHTAPAPIVAEAREASAPVERRPGEAVRRPPPVAPEPPRGEARPHASPLVRGFARDLGVDLSQARGSGPSGRVLKDDVKALVRERLAGEGGTGVPSLPSVDFSRFGEVTESPLSKIRRSAATNLRRSWLNLPHVTQHDEADVTELEAFRRSCAEQAAERGLKLSPLHFVMKAVCIVLRELADFRSSLSADGERLLIKQYYHLGIAVDTEHGLVVPVVRDVDQKGIFELASELAGLAERARARKLAPSDMQGASFTISSLGGIGGTAFTPIVNAPEVAILGLSKLQVQPVWSARLDVSAEGRGAFEPRIVLPLSLSYDHRVIDGAAGARFTARLAALLSHPSNLLL